MTQTSTVIEITLAPLSDTKIQNKRVPGCFGKRWSFFLPMTDYIIKRKIVAVGVGKEEPAKNEVFSRIPGTKRLQALHILQAHHTRHKIMISYKCVFFLSPLKKKLNTL